jgi:hypothetical protein
MQMVIRQTSIAIIKAHPAIFMKTKEGGKICQRAVRLAVSVHSRTGGNPRWAPAFAGVMIYRKTHAVGIRRSQISNRKS